MSNFIQNATNNNVDGVIACVNYQKNCGRSINGDFHGQKSWLTIATELDKPDIVKALLEHGAEVSFIQSDGRTCLHAAAIQGRSIQILTDLLQQQDAEKVINQQDQRGNTALMWAVKTNNLLAVQELLKHKANPNLSDKDGNTPLHLAIAQHNLDMVKALLDYHADPTQRSFQGLTALHLALTAPDHGSKAEIIHQLIIANENEISLSKKLEERNGFFFKIWRRLTQKQVEKLVDQKTPQGRTPLHLAVLDNSQHRKEICLELLSRAKRDEKDLNGNTAEDLLKNNHPAKEEFKAWLREAVETNLSEVKHPIFVIKDLNNIIADLTV